MFVRRLLVSAVLACLAACTTTSTAPTTYSVGKNPNLEQSTNIGNSKALDYQLMPQRSGNPFSSTVSTANAVDTAVCLKQRLSSEFKMPEEFISHKIYTDNNHSVGLINPFTKTEGITMDVVSKGGHSEIKLYDNGNLLSRAWKQLPSKCGQGKTTTLASNDSKTTASPNTSNGINFVAKTNASKDMPLARVTEAKITNPKNTVASAPLIGNHNFIVAQPQIRSTPIAANTITASPVSIADADTGNKFAANTASKSAWEHGELTQDDMNIIVPATAAVFTPLMAKAASSTLSNSASNKPVVATPTARFTSPTASNRAATTASRPTTKTNRAKSKPSSKPTETKKDTKAVVQSKKTDPKQTNSKTNAGKNDKTNKNKLKTEEVKNNSKTSKTDNKATAKDKKTTERNSKVASNSKTNKNSKSTADNKSSGTKNNTAKAADKETNSKAKATNNKGKATDKKAEKNKTSNKNSKAKG